ncbi:MAG: hypothetical protein AAFP90_09935 [Planctomycetota bacterium]
MLQLVAESPITLSIVLGLLGLGCLFGWLQSGKKAAGVVGVVFLLLIPVAWIVAGLIQTEREAILEMIDTAAAAVERNDVDAAISHIDPRLREVNERAKMALNSVKFSRARVTRVREVNVRSDATPMTAKVDLSVSVTVSARNGMVEGVKRPARLQLELRKNSKGQWKVIDYQQSEIVGGGLGDKIGGMP